MKKKLVLLLMISAMALSGCQQKEKAPETTVPSISISQTEEDEKEQLEEIETTEEKMNAETLKPEESTESAAEEVVETVDNNIDNVYEKQMKLFYRALSEKWDISQCFDNDISSLVANHREGDALENVGYALKDLDRDGKDELLIGALNRDFDGGMLYDIYTEKDGEVVHVLSGHERNRYYLQWLEEGIYMIANEASNSAYSCAWYYYTLSGGELELIQGVVFDGSVDENNPWYLTYDTDWDVSNDTHDTDGVAESLVEVYTKQYATLEYTPFSEYDTLK